MNQAPTSYFTRTLFMMSFVVWVLGGGMAFSQTPAGEAPDTPPTVQEESTTSEDQGEVIERGIHRRDLDGQRKRFTPPKTSIPNQNTTSPVKDKVFERPRQPQPSESPPAHLCTTETRMLTQCKCFNPVECQALTAVFPNSCPAGSQHCEFVPMSRGAMPPLPPNLCGYQIPWTMMKCSCSNQADCQLLSPFCPSSCPMGSLSCQCTPLQRR